MTDADFIRAERRRELGEFADCDSLTEVLVVAAATLGLDCVRQIAEQLVEDKRVWREELREIADAVALVELNDLSKTLRQVARHTPRKPLEELNNRERLARGLPPSRAGEHYLRQQQGRQKSSD